MTTGDGRSRCKTRFFLRQLRISNINMSLNLVMPGPKSLSAAHSRSAVCSRSAVQRYHGAGTTDNQGQCRPFSVP